MSVKYLSDEFLFDYFLKKIDPKKLFKQYSGEIKKKIKELLENERKLIKAEASENREGFIPKSQQRKIEIIKDLWELLIREAIYCLRSKDSEDLNLFKQDFGIIEIKQYFEKFSEFEEVLHGTDRYYRDHSLHVIRVFFLGFYLLSSKLSNLEGTEINFNSIKILPSEIFKEVRLTLEEIQAIWILIALTHDLGYPIEKIEHINQKITGLISYYGPSGIEEFKYHLPPQNQFLNDFILKFISSKLIHKQNEVEYYTVIQNKYYLKFAKAFENFSHGIMSCILLMKHLVYFKESDYSHSGLNGLTERDAIQFSIRRTILRSIASHDNEDIYHIYPNNFRFILTFCDDLQEWDRPRVTGRFQKSEKILIPKFNSNEIHFEKHIILSENIEISIEHIEVFAQNVRKYIKLFRSGPNSNNRTFTFTFKIKAKIEETKIIEIFSFEYPTNKAPNIKIPLLNLEKHELLDIFLDFIRSNYIINERIETLLEKLNLSLESKIQNS